MTDKSVLDERPMDRERERERVCHCYSHEDVLSSPVEFIFTQLPTPLVIVSERISEGGM